MRSFRTYGWIFQSQRARFNSSLQRVWAESDLCTCIIVYTVLELDSYFEIHNRYKSFGIKSHEENFWVRIVPGMQVGHSNFAFSTWCSPTLHRRSNIECMYWKIWYRTESDNSMRCENGNRLSMMGNVPHRNEDEMELDDLEIDSERDRVLRQKFCTIFVRIYVFLEGLTYQWSCTANSVVSSNVRSGEAWALGSVSQVISTVRWWWWWYWCLRVILSLLSLYT